MIINEDLFEDVPSVETEIDITETEGPEIGEDIGVADLIHSAIIDEHEAIQKYNTMKANVSSNPFLLDIVEHIAAEEMNHVGMLEGALQRISPNAENIMIGAREVFDDLHESVVRGPKHKIGSVEYDKNEGKQKRIEMYRKIAQLGPDEEITEENLNDYALKYVCVHNNRGIDQVKGELLGYDN